MRLAPSRIAEKIMDNLVEECPTGNDVNMLTVLLLTMLHDSHGNAYVQDLLDEAIRFIEFKKECEDSGKIPKVSPNLN